MSTHTQEKRLPTYIGYMVLALAAMLFFFATAYAVTEYSQPVPVDGDGAYQDWTARPGGSHFANVDEEICNGETDYNATITVGDRDSYTVDISDIPNGDTISAISLFPCASRNNAGYGSSTLRVFYRWNGVDSYDKGWYALSSTTPMPLSSTTFHNLSLEKDASSTLEVGAVFTDGNMGARLSQMNVLIFAY